MTTIILHIKEEQFRDLVGVFATFVEPGVWVIPGWLESIGMQKQYLSVA